MYLGGMEKTERGFQPYGNCQEIAALYRVLVFDPMERHTRIAISPTVFAGVVDLMQQINSTTGWRSNRPVGPLVRIYLIESQVSATYGFRTMKHAQN